jgi:hypothetical protein
MRYFEIDKAEIQQLYLHYIKTKYKTVVQSLVSSKRTIEKKMVSSLIQEYWNYEDLPTLLSLKLENNENDHQTSENNQNNHQTSQNSDDDQIISKNRNLTDFHVPDVTIGDCIRQFQQIARCDSSQIKDLISNAVQDLENTVDLVTKEPKTKFNKPSKRKKRPRINFPVTGEYQQLKSLILEEPFDSENLPLKKSDDGTVHLAIYYQWSTSFLQSVKKQLLKQWAIEYKLSTSGTRNQLIQRLIEKKVELLKHQVPFTIEVNKKSKRIDQTPNLQEAIIDKFQSKNEFNDSISQQIDSTENQTNFLQQETKSNQHDMELQKETNLAPQFLSDFDEGEGEDLSIIPTIDYFNGVKLNELQSEFPTILSETTSWFTDNIINSFFYILSKNIKSVEFYHTFITAGSYNQNYRFLGIDNVSNFSKIYPVNLGNYHWICIHFHKSNHGQQIDWYDSGKSKVQITEPQLLCFKSAGKFKFNCIPVKLQDFSVDSWNCGSYVCAFAIALAKNFTINFRNLQWLQKSISHFRSLILNDIESLMNNYSPDLQPQCKALEWFEKTYQQHEFLFKRRSNKQVI